MKFLVILLLILGTATPMFLFRKHDHKDCRKQNLLLNALVDGHEKPTFLEKIRSLITGFTYHDYPTQSGLETYHPHFYPIYLVSGEVYQAPFITGSQETDLGEDGVISHQGTEPLAVTPNGNPVVEQNIKEIFTEEKYPLQAGKVTEQKKISTTYPVQKRSQVKYPNAVSGSQNHYQGGRSDQVYTAGDVWIEEDISNPNVASLAQTVDPTSDFEEVTFVSNKVKPGGYGAGQLLNGETSQTIVMRQPSRYPIGKQYYVPGFEYLQPQLGSVYNNRLNNMFFSRTPSNRWSFQRYPLRVQQYPSQEIVKGQNFLRREEPTRSYPAQNGAFAKNIPQQEVYKQNSPKIGPVIFTSRFKEDIPTGKHDTDDKNGEKVEKKNTADESSPSEADSTEGEIVVKKGMQVPTTEVESEEVVANKSTNVGDSNDGNVFDAIKVDNTSKTEEDTQNDSSKIEISVGGNIVEEPVANLTKPEDVKVAGNVTEVAARGIESKGSDKSEPTEIKKPSDEASPVQNEADDVRVESTTLTNKDIRPELAQRHETSEKETDKSSKINHDIDPVEVDSETKDEPSEKSSKIQTREAEFIEDPRTISVTIELPPKTITKTVTQVSKQHLQNGTGVEVSPVKRIETVVRKSGSPDHSEPIVTNQHDGVKITFGGSSNEPKGQNLQHIINIDPVSGRGELDKNNQMA